MYYQSYYRLEYYWYLQIRYWIYIFDSVEMWLCTCVCVCLCLGGACVCACLPAVQACDVRACVCVCLCLGGACVCACLPVVQACDVRACACICVWVVHVFALVCLLSRRVTCVHVNVKFNVINLTASVAVLVTKNRCNFLFVHVTRQLFDHPAS